MNANTNDHPAVAGAKRAIRRSLARLTPVQVFHVAALVDPGGMWGLSASYAETQPAHVWKCDAPKKRGDR